MSLTQIAAAMVAADVATQVELDAEATTRGGADASAAARLDTLELPGRVVQVVNTAFVTYDTTTTLIPFDDTIPQITEGKEFFTLAITPKATTNKLKIEVKVFCSTSTGSIFATVALFQDAVANALCVGAVLTPATDGLVCITFTYYMTAGTVSATTFRVRAGPHSASTLYINGSVAARKYGGVLTSSITITEIKV